MKWLLLLELLLIVIYITKENNKDCNHKTVSAEDDNSICLDTDVDPDFRCCYVYFYDDEDKEAIKCHAIYWDDEGYDKFVEAVKDYSNLDIQCSSIWISIYTTYVFLLFIF